MRQWLEQIRKSNERFRTAITFGVLSLLVSFGGILAGQGEFAGLCFVAGLVLTSVPIVLQVDVLRAVDVKFEESLRAARQGDRAAIERLSEEVRIAVSQLAWATDIEKAEATTTRNSFAHVREAANVQLAQTRATIRRLADQTVTYSSGVEDEAVIIASIEQAEREILATHDCRSQRRWELWETDKVQERYLKKQGELIRAAKLSGQPFSILRIFILPKELQRPSYYAIAHIVRQHQSYGIEVLVARGIDLSEQQPMEQSGTQVVWPRDVVIVDDKIVHLYEFDARRGYGSISLSTNKDIVAESRQAFGALRKKARPWAEVSEDIQQELAAMPPPAFYSLNGHVYEERAFECPPSIIAAFLANEHTVLEKFLDNAMKDSPNPTLIDFGCGTGHYLAYALKHTERNASPLTAIGIESSATLADFAAERLRWSKAEIAVENVIDFSGDRVPGFPIGMCTYNTIGVCHDVNGFLSRMKAVCNGGHLLVSWFDGSKFEQCAREVYDKWSDFVGPSSAGEYDYKDRVYTNGVTGFRSKWYTRQEIEEALGGRQPAKLTPGIESEHDIGLHLSFKFGRRSS